MKKKPPTGAAKSIPAGLGIGLLVSLSVTLLLAVLASWLIVSEVTPQDSLGYWAMGIMFVSTVAGALTSVCIIQRLRLQMSLLSALCYYVSLLCITGLFFGGQYQGMGTAGIMVILGALVSIGLGMVKKNNRKNTYRKKAYR